MSARPIAVAALGFLLLTNSGLADTSLKSGPQVGEKNNPARVLSPVGRRSGGRLHAAARSGSQADAVALIFVREMSDPWTSLVKKIDQRVNESAGHRTSGPELGTYIIFDNNANGLDKQRSARWLRRNRWKRVSLGIGTPPGDYNLAKKPM